MWLMASLHAAFSNTLSSGVNTNSGLVKPRTSRTGPWLSWWLWWPRDLGKILLDIWRGERTPTPFQTVSAHVGRLLGSRARSTPTESQYCPGLSIQLTDICIQQSVGQVPGKRDRFTIGHCNFPSPSLQSWLLQYLKKLDSLAYTYKKLRETGSPWSHLELHPWTSSEIHYLKRKYDTRKLWFPTCSDCKRLLQETQSSPHTELPLMWWWAS